MSHALASGLCYIGDSQSASKAALFDTLQSKLSSHLDVVSGRAVCGAPIAGYLGHNQLGCRYKGVTHLEIEKSAASFVSNSGRTDDIGQICAKTDGVIVQLGDNNLGNPKMAGADAARLVRKVNSMGQRCVWIGPASIGTARCSQKRKEKGEVSSAIRQAIEPLGCKFVDSFALTDGHPLQSRDPMCIHYPGLYLQWAAAIEPSLKSALELTKNSEPEARESTRRSAQ